MITDNDLNDYIAFEAMVVGAKKTGSCLQAHAVKRVLATVLPSVEWSWTDEGRMACGIPQALYHSSVQADRDMIRRCLRIADVYYTVR